jgi:hypothetical protein
MQMGIAPASFGWGHVAPYYLPANHLAGGKDFLPPRLQDSKAPEVLSLISWRLSIFATWRYVFGYRSPPARGIENRGRMR